MSTIKKRVVDVLIVGDGIAGCMAALAARKSGADVMIVENSQPNVPHGNTAFCGGALRRVSKEYPETKYFADIMKVSQGQADEELTRITIRNSRRAKASLSRLGIRWTRRLLIREGRIALSGKEQSWHRRFARQSRKRKYPFSMRQSSPIFPSPTVRWEA